MARRSVYLEVGGYFEPYFFGTSEVDLATRMLAAGWDVRYVPAAVVDHLKEQSGRTSGRLMRRYRVRNQIWYFSLRFPLSMAIRRIPAYLLFDLIECAWHGASRDYFRGIVDAWRQRALVRGQRDPLPRDVLRRAEMNRGRLHMRFLVEEIVLKLRRLLRRGSG
jgi:GT2 family glycosyltransferase